MPIRKGYVGEVGTTDISFTNENGAQVGEQRCSERAA